MYADRMALVRQVPLFAPLRAAEVAFLAGVLRDAAEPAGKVLFKEDDPGDSFHIIVEGQVEIVKAAGTPDERLLAVRGPGEFFGEMSLLDPGGRRVATVRTRTPVRLLQMQRGEFDALLHERPALAYEMGRVLSIRLRDSDNATIADLHAKNQDLKQAYEDLKAAQAQIIEKEKLEQELRTAHWMQQSILPIELPCVPGFDLAARMEPARAVGGDLYDFIPLEDGAVGVVIGDVSDKGVHAGLFMAMTHSLLRAEARRAGSPADVLRRVNTLLEETNTAGMFVTAVYGVLDPARRTFTYARAGHEVPLLIDPDGEVTTARQGIGQPLGLFADVRLDEQAIDLPRGSGVLMYTDGATDMRDANGTFFELEGLRGVVWRGTRRADAGETSARALCDCIWEALCSHKGAGSQDDDVALVAIRAV